MTPSGESDFAATCPAVDERCDSCRESLRTDVCPSSLKTCGHHCNHSWSHERCCWCGREWGDELDELDGDASAAAEPGVPDRGMRPTLPGGRSQPVTHAPSLQLRVQRRGLAHAPSA
jgi:hypothetical protein